ncbi:uncharacterized protein LOC122274343 [Carya illinoinensis]|uniref:uncharacterized protein LOC122274343 n=1 Tax=Carya illinoinensis TaxID=32201 RepID=UPI001C725BEA|nr:uncharacterized protein LOC122274343 [Carya illinoinensis]
MASPRLVFVRMSNGEDFIKGFSREAYEIDGVQYRVFQWSTDYVEDQEPSVVPIWIFLPGLPPNYYHESFLWNITLPLGQYIRRDNCTCCATKTDGARVCIKMDISKPPMEEFWIGVSNQQLSWVQQERKEKQLDGGAGSSKEVGLIVVKPNSEPLKENDNKLVEGDNNTHQVSVGGEKQFVVSDGEGQAEQDGKEEGELDVVREAGGEDWDDMGVEVQLEGEDFHLRQAGEHVNKDVVEDGELVIELRGQSDSELYTGIDNLAKGKACSSDSENVSPKSVK